MSELEEAADEWRDGCTVLGGLEYKFVCRFFAMEENGELSRQTKMEVFEVWRGLVLSPHPHVTSHKMKILSSILETLYAAKYQILLLFLCAVA